MTKPIKILHVFPDDKFFDPVSCYFDEIPDVENLYYYYDIDRCYQFKMIKRSDKITLFHDKKEYVKNLSRKDIQIIYFHSLPSSKYWLFNYIDSNKIVIWWSWGYDIYDSFFGLQPLIPLYKIKGLTMNWIHLIEKDSDRNKFQSLVDVLLRPYYRKMQKRVISRIDYYTPVLPIEYDLMKDFCPFFHANPFMLERGPGRYVDYEFTSKKTLGNVLIGNSLTYTNNHFDIFNCLQLRSIDIHPYKFIVPISYGDAYGGMESFKRIAKEFPLVDNNCIYLTDFLTRDQYYGLLESITHAVFGVIRQQAMGNILYLLRNGVKIYLYKDSLVYIYLKSLGFFIYNIEDDLTQDSMEQVLDEEKALHNFNLVKRRNEFGKIDFISKELSTIIKKNQ